MGKHELIEAFVRGDIDRRQFVSRLTMLGVSSGAAIAYASSLGQSAAAAPVGSGAGFIMRAQDADDPDYGTAILIEVIEALEEVAARIQNRILAVMAALEEVLDGAVEERVLGILERIRQQQQEHFDAVIAQLRALAGADAGVESEDGDGDEEFDSPEEFMTTLADRFDELTRMYAAIVPATLDGATRQLLMNIASVASRHAALVSFFADGDPIPGAFEEPEL